MSETTTSGTTTQLLGGWGGTARTSAAVLPVTSAGLCMHDQLRLPLAASDEDAVIAEKLQTTIGEGPCLGAVAADGPLAADLDAMKDSWPVFHERFVAETPYRSVASFPLSSAGGSPVGALDLYSANPEPLTFIELEAVNSAVANPIARLLFGKGIAGWLDEVTGTGWLDGESVEERMNVWVAVGSLMGRLQLRNADALALLRGYAYVHEMTLDHAALLITDEGLRPEEILRLA